MDRDERKHPSKVSDSFGRDGIVAMDYPNTEVRKAQGREKSHRREMETEHDRAKHKHRK